jgi:ABC-type Fe3+/spermidine/putrescine transport system ATPase subunit
VAAAGPGVVTVSSSVGTFAARCADDIAPGERAKLVIRPHAVEIGEGEGGFPATILHVHFLGEFTELILQADDNQIRAHCKSTAFCSGQTVQARLLQAELRVTR